MAETMASTRMQCCATDKACAPLVWPFHRATRARPWAMSEISMSKGDGSIRSRRRPESMRCQTRAGSGVSIGAFMFGSLDSPLSFMPEVEDATKPHMRRSDDTR